MGDFSNIRRIRVCYIINGRLACKDYVFSTPEKAYDFAEIHIPTTLDIYDIDDNLLYSKPLLLTDEIIETKYEKFVNWLKSLVNIRNFFIQKNKS